MKRQALLFGITLAAWAILALPATYWFGGAPLPLSLAAAGLCLVPAALTLLISDRLRHRPAEEKIVIVLVATVLRMGFAVGVGVLLWFKWPMVKEHATGFVGWVIAFYLVTLAVETTLLYRDAAPPIQAGTESGPTS